jgi:hypothetical protein
MRILTPEQIEVLEENDWEIICESPFEMEFNSQFQGSRVCNSTEEAYEIYKGIVERRQYTEWVKQRAINEKENDIKDFKSKVKALLVTGITEETLLEFYCVSCWWGKKHGKEVTSTTLKEYFKEVFDEVDNS